MKGLIVILRVMELRSLTCGRSVQTQALGYGTMGYARQPDSLQTVAYMKDTSTQKSIWCQNLQGIYKAISKAFARIGVKTSQMIYEVTSKAPIAAKLSHRPRTQSSCNDNVAPDDFGNVRKRVE
eukprot:3820846-Amphidinium_carterae.2